MENYIINSVSVIGAGSWGTAVAKLFSNKVDEVVVWDRKLEIVDEMNNFHTNSKYLPSVDLLKNIKATNNFKDIINCDITVLAIPAQVMRKIIGSLPNLKKSIFLICAKGIENSSLKLLSQVIEERFDNPIAVLSGPNFVHEIARDLPTASTVACSNPDIAKAIAEVLNSPTFRCYINSDVIGTQISGAVKNVIAIAVGICAGLNLGENAKASLITKGLEEIKILSNKLGGNEDTVNSIAGIGDLILTCNTTNSRNMNLGYLIGQKGSAKDIVDQNNKVIEGCATSKSVHELSKKLKIELPICEAVYSILHQAQSVEQAMKKLLDRPVKL